MAERSRAKRELVAKSFKLSQEADFLLDQLATEMGLSLTGVIETCLRRVAKQEGIIGSDGKRVGEAAGEREP